MARTPDTLLVCGVGDVHGRLDRLAELVAGFEAHLGTPFDLLLQVGDLGAWPDHDKVDKATRRHGDAGDFAAWRRDGRAWPRPGLFIKGNHEDFDFLARHAGAEVLPGLRHLPGAGVFEVGGLRIGGIGGNFSPSDWPREARNLRDRARRHYTHDEVGRLALQRFDVLLTHDAPADAPLRTRQRGYVIPTEGLVDLPYRCGANLHLFGHHHQRVVYRRGLVDVHGLAIVGEPGALAAFRYEGKVRVPQYLGDWPPAPEAAP
jgi:predicted phosphodiesterase